MHERFDAGQLLAELAAGMEVREVLFFKAALFGERDCERVAESKHCSRRSRGREAERAGFLVDGTVECDVGGFG